MARKRRDLPPEARERIREIAIEEAMRIVNESTGIVGTIGTAIPLTRPFARATASAVRRSAKLLLESGALDSYIDSEITRLSRQRGFDIVDVEKKSRAELLFDLAEAGIDILADPEVQKELDELDRASRDMGTPLPGREVIRRSGQFSRQNLLPDITGISRKQRKKSKNDKNMSEALKQANSKLRKKNGQLRKGKTQRDVMRLAQRLAKKMSK